jgi:general secretion pathway protein F
MAAFEYTVLDKKGRERKGVMESDSPRQVRQSLRDDGLIPTSVTPIIKKNKTKNSDNPLNIDIFKRGISSSELSLLTRQLSTLIQAGIPLEESLNAVSQQMDSARLKTIMVGVRSKVIEGHSLASGLSEFPHIFPSLFRTTVEAGEQTGHLDTVLDRLAEYTENRQKIQQKIMLALIYPAVITFVAIIVVSALLAFVVPKVVRVFEDIGENLPPLTRAIIQLSDFVRDYGALVLIGSLLAMLGFQVLKQNINFKLKYDRFLLRLPAVSKLIKSINSARFSRTFGILMSSGVDVIEALRISAKVMSNAHMSASVLEAATKVREGSNLYIALEQTKAFNPMTLHLIASGESSGKLPEMLDRAAENQERDLETTVSATVGIFEPLLILAMGGMVLMIVLAILMPIFDLNQLVK